MNGETNLIVNANKFKLENEFWIILQYTVHMDINDAYVTPPPSPNKTSMILEVYIQLVKPWLSNYQSFIMISLISSNWDYYTEGTRFEQFLVFNS